MDAIPVWVGKSSLGHSDRCAHHIGRENGVSIFVNVRVSVEYYLEDGVFALEVVRVSVVSFELRVIPRKSVKVGGSSTGVDC